MKDSRLGAREESASRESGNPLPHPAALRAACREGRFAGTTSGACPGFAQANLIVLPRSLSRDFRQFCERNPKPCPLLAVSEGPVLTALAPGADLRTDLPRYRVTRRGGEQRETGDVREVWGPDLTAFLLGCSFGFEAGLVEAGIRLRHQDEGRIVPMYRTARECDPEGPFHGRLVVTMRPIPESRVDDAVRISGEQPLAHGAPVHVGDPAALGIRDLSRPDWGEDGGLLPGEIPVFWACGVTSQVACRNARPDLMISHAPGFMFVTDVPVADQKRGALAA
jgi:uncharacterized protein YcsI (UPF0317 family)